MARELSPLSGFKITLSCQSSPPPEQQLPAVPQERMRVSCTSIWTVNDCHRRISNTNLPGFDTVILSHPGLKPILKIHRRTAEFPTLTMQHCSFWGILKHLTKTLKTLITLRGFHIACGLYLFYMPGLHVKLATSVQYVADNRVACSERFTSEFIDFTWMS